MNDKSDKAKERGVNLSIVFAVGVLPAFVCWGGHLQSDIIVMLIFFLLKTTVELLWDDGLNAYPIFAVDWVEFAVSILIHIVRPHIPSNFGIFIHAFESFSFRVPVVLESDRIVGEPLLFIVYPLVLAVLFVPMIWLMALNSSRSFIFCW